MKTSIVSLSLQALLAVALVFALGACSDRKNYSPFPTISDQAKRDLSAPINCETAKHDIATLEEEKASVGKRVLSGVRSILPISVVAGLLMGDYGSRVEVAAGTYNADIEGKIAEIKAACGIKIQEIE